ncbi:PREDICTED: T-cell leukemia/lymphoma protein 1A [Elephantulus edwardii]|uniref:T-cell leukemia/lymphoma protein 1A n=1 Tax=Elephantulus edwardii TaxID=28737 RepID=UPI0003F0C1B8|nr:PREDICTED: T-cell leukemia/lymphoma protein 1A [Elephantulus edwardii]
MGELPSRISQHPNRLWLWEKSVYVDEKQRSWMAVVLEEPSVLKVLLRQINIPLGEPVCPSQVSSSYNLPLMWQLYPGNWYKGSDSRYDDTEDLVLEQQPSEEEDQ